jgi:FKBP-type peptidyl-prolyl cis-trans isomerase
MSATLSELKQQIKAAQLQHRRRKLETRREEVERERRQGAEFLAANAAKPGVQTLASGLQYRVVQVGSGRTPGPTDTVTLHYRGTRIDGSEFDSSYADGAPAAFRVDQVIRGWTEALQLMREGAKWELYIPPQLGFGRSGPMADETLIYEIELLAVGERREAARQQEQP